MKSQRLLFWSFRAACVVAFAACAFLMGCSGGEKIEPSPATSSNPAADATKNLPKTPFVPVDACSLLSKADAEAITGKSVAEPLKETVANLTTCTFGDPASPKLPNGNFTSRLLALAVFTGEEGAYYAGPVAQAKDSFETGRKNAASVENVAGLGQAAYWDKILHTLHVIKDRYEIEVSVDSELGLKVARGAAEKAIARLP